MSCGAPLLGAPPSYQDPLEPSLCYRRCYLSPTSTVSRPGDYLGRTDYVITGRVYLELADAPPARGRDAVLALDSPAMGFLTFSLNVTLDGCVDHQEGIADDETRAFFTRLMDESGAMLWGRVTYGMLE